jgi:hypothetical protein
MERAVAATRKPHAHRIIRVTNAPEIEFRNQQRRDEQRGEIMASCGSAPGLKSGNGGIKICRTTLISLLFSPNWGEKRACCINTLRAIPQLQERPLSTSLRRVHCSIHLMWPTFCIDVGASRCIPARETQRHNNGDAKSFSESGYFNGARWSVQSQSWWAAPQPRRSRDRALWRNRRSSSHSCAAHPAIRAF